MRSIRNFALLFLAIALGPPVIAQSTAGPFPITSSSSPCARIGTNGQATVIVKVSGTFSLTLQPEVSITGQAPDNAQVTPSTSSTKQSTITAAGSYTLAAGGYDTVLVCVTGYVSGTANVYLTASPALNANNIGSSAAGASFPIIAAQTVNSGGSLAPSTIGQNIGSQLWLAAGLTTPTVAFSSNSGGALNTNFVWIQYTLNTAAGETLPSDIAQSTNPGSICSGATCQATVTAPTIPSGYTGYTVYSCQAALQCAPLKQAAGPACVNITTNCIISTIGAGAALPTTNTAWTQPANIQSTLCPASIQPSIFAFKADSNSYTESGMDFSTTSVLPSPMGTPIWCDRFFINDTKQTIGGSTQQGGGPIRNALFSVSHQSGNTTTTGGTTDDRVIAYRGVDSTTSPAYEQWLGVYGEHFIYNNNFSCAPVGTTFIGEDCAAALRVRTNDQRTAGVNNLTLVGIHGTASTNVASPHLTGSPSIVGVVGTADQETVSSQNPGGAAYVGVLGSTNGSAGNTNGIGYSFWALAPTTRFATQNGGMFIGSFLGSNATDYALRSDATAKSALQGSLFIGATPALGTALSTLNVTGSFLNSGSLGTTQFATPAFSNGNITNIGAAGAVTYTYKVVAKDGNDAGTAASAAGTTTTGNATLNGSNFNRIQINFCNGLTGLSASPFGWTKLDIYRTASGGTPSSTGKIGSLTPTYFGNLGSLGTCNFNFDDTGLAGDSSTAPAANTTAGDTIAGDLTFSSGKGQHVNTQAANNDISGTCTLSAGSCTVTFTRAYTAAPVCIATPSTTGTFTTTATLKVAPTTTTVVLSSTTGTDTAVINYICYGNPN